MIGAIDEPQQNSVYSSSEFNCRGWAFSENGIESIKIFIDAVEVGNAEHGLLRWDVKGVFPQYPDIEKSGFQFLKKVSLENGSHELKVVVQEKNDAKFILGNLVFTMIKKGTSSNIISRILPIFFNKKEEIQNSANDRKRVSFNYLHGNGIEIGALHNPLLVSELAHVKYIDRFSLSDLKKHYPELNSHHLVPIDIIDDGETLSTIPDNSLDFIIANHFLEHCENPIGTIRNHLRKIKLGGILYYAIPEKSNTFDKDRPVTDFNHNMEDDLQGPSISRKQHFYEWVTFIQKAQDTNEIEKQVTALMEKQYSIHYHVWDTTSIFQFFYKTNDYLKNSFAILHFEKNENEIIIIVQKKGS